MSSTTNKTSGTTSAPAAPKMTGKPFTENLVVESSEKGPSGMPMQGVNAVHVTLGCDGWGHWRAENMGDDAPVFGSRDEAVKWVTSEGIKGGTLVTEPST